MITMPTIRLEPNPGNSSVLDGIGTVLANDSSTLANDASVLAGSSIASSGGIGLTLEVVQPSIR